MINRVILVLSIAIFALRGIVYAGDKKEEAKQYVSKVNPVLISAQVTTRNINQKFLSLETTVKQMKEYIKQLRAIKPPDFMAKQHKMILLSFQKMKADFLKKGGLIKEKDPRLQQRPILPPVAPMPAPMFSPTPSPHITAPQVTPQAIDLMTQVDAPYVSNSPGMQNIPSKPAYAIPPNVSTEVPQMPVTSNAVLTVTPEKSKKE